MKVVVTGASGFIGGHVIRRLVEDGHTVTGVARDLPSDSRTIDSVRYIAGVNVRDFTSLPEDAFGEADAVVHLVGIIQERKPKQTFQSVHVDGTRNVVQASKKGEVRRFLYLSAIGSKPNAAAEYSRTKAQAEDIVRASGLETVILRPSIVLGRDGEFVEQMTKLVKYGGLPVKLPFPLIPVPGSGNNKFQPIFVDDLAECVSKSLTRSDVTGQAIEVGGWEQVTFNELITAFAKANNVKKPVLHAPIAVLKLIAPLIELLPKPPFSGDQLKNLGLDNTTDITDMRRIFNIEPKGFGEIMSEIYGP